MGSLIVVIIVAGIAFLSVRGTRRNRARWLAKLDLPGIWEREGREGRLELSGELNGGSYAIRDPEGEERGRWHLDGHTLALTSESGKRSEYDLRLFEEGKIGIDGPERPRRVYQKVPSNVVPLRSGSRRRPGGQS